jgi:hypothetical protein
MEILFYRHQTKGQKARGMCTLYHRITINSERAELYSTHLKCHFDDFDPERQRVKPSDREYLYKNGRLNLIEGDLLEIYTTLSRRKKPFTPHQIKEMYMSETQELRLMDIFDKWLKALRDAGEPQKQTVDRYEDIRDNVLKFLITKRRQTDLLENFDLDTFLQYRNYIKKEGFADSTIRKHQSVIKQMLTWAKLEKYLAQNPLDGYKIRHEKLKPHIFLTVEQFELLRTHQFSTERLQRVADVFVVFCRTGFHWQDLKDMAKSGEEAIYQVAEFDFIKWNRVKTKEMAKVPSNAWPEVNQVVAKYGGWNKLPIVSNTKMNDYLKLVAAELNVAIMKMSVQERRSKNLTPVNPELTVKAGRKTLADWLLNELGWSREAVKVVLGLKSDRTLDSYVREDERRVLRELRRGNDSQQSA